MTVGTSARTTENQRTVVGVFDGPNHAERALNQLRDAGFSPDQVSVVAKDTRESREMVESSGMGEEGAASGAIAGTLLGGIAGWLLGISALTIPGIGPIVGAGIIGTTLAGAGIGAATGGLIGALAGHGVPEDDARGYEDNVKKGSILLTVHAQTDEQAQRAHQIFGQGGGSDVRAYGVQGITNTTGATARTVGTTTGATLGTTTGTTTGTMGSSTTGRTTGASGDADTVITSGELRDGETRRRS